VQTEPSLLGRLVVKRENSKMPKEETGVFENPVSERDSTTEDDIVPDEPNSAKSQSIDDVLSPQEAIYEKMGIRSEIFKGDVDAFIYNWCSNAHNSNWLETMIILCILINTVLLAWQNPATILDNDYLEAFMYIDYVLTVSFPDPYM
jgi:hypothetical protein